MAASFNRRVAALEQAARPDDFTGKLSALVPDDATDREIQQARRQWRTEVFRVSADPFIHSFLG